MAKVFICYSHEDERILTALTVHLNPFVDNGELQLWFDRKIQAGDDWDRKIREIIRSADAAVLLISPDFLASRYIIETEVPLLMAAAEQKQLLLAPLFVRPSNVGALAFNVTNVDTGEAQVTISRYQGLNDLSQPIVQAGEVRDDLLAEAARRLADSLRQQAAPRERIHRAGHRELTVELRRNGLRIDRRYSRPRDAGFLNNRMEVPQPRFDTLSRCALGEDVPAELGGDLFEMLLGGEKDWPSVLRRAVGEDVLSPIRHAFRIRILTEDAWLRALPWGTSCWRGYPLSEQGWTFELGAGPEPSPFIRLDTPCSAAMISAEPADMPPLGSDAHYSGLELIFGEAWDHPARKPCIERAETVAGAVALLRSAPRLLYIYTHVREGASGLELILVDDAKRAVPLSMTELLEIVARRPPHILVLQSIGACSPARPVPGVPVLLHLRRAAASLKARQEVQVWWRDVLGTQADPVRAFHDLGANARRAGVIVTDYERWETTLSHYTPRTDRPRSRLDRRLQRQAIWDAVRDLVQSPQRRVACVVVYGAPGNLLADFASASIDTMKEWDPNLARLHYYPIHLPETREPFSIAKIEEKFRDLMSLQPPQELAEAFQERTGGAQATPVHFLDWGTYGPDGRPALRTDHLEAWLTFCCENLREACTGRQRILNYLAVILNEAKHDDLRNWIEARREEPRFRRPYFDLVLVPALGKVTAVDLSRFMEKEENSSCPHEYLEDLPERIILRTGGDFERTVKLLEEAERGMMWPELYETLPQRPQTAIRHTEFVLE